MSIIELKDVYFAYDHGQKTETRAVRGVSLGICEGEFVAIVGHNGSGKSTLARLINGLLTPSSGDILVDGLSTKDEKNLFEIRKTVGVVFQNPDNQMVATIIEDDVAFGPENIGLPSNEIRKRVDEALRAVNMYEHRENSPHHLSGGQKQRIAIAGVLALRPRVMIFDESTSMLDPDGRAEVMKVIKKLNSEEGIAVVIITHFMEEAALADRIIVMNEGEILMQGGKEIFAREDELIAVGLTVPLASRVANALRRNGANLPIEIADADALVKAIEELK